MTQARTIETALGGITTGSTVAIGGVGLTRKPMALVRALIEHGITDLHIVSFLGSVDVELLLASGVVAELHTAGTDLESAGLAPQYRHARQTGTPTVVEWSEGSLHAALEATARALPSMPCSTGPRSGVVAANPNLVSAPDPFDGQDIVHAKAFPIDVALLHLPAADREGNLFCQADIGMDGLMARAADNVVVSVEEITARPVEPAAISRLWVDSVVVEPGGAWPTGCPSAMGVDIAAVQSWAAAKGSEASLLLTPPTAGAPR